MVVDESVVRVESAHLLHQFLAMTIPAHELTSSGMTEVMNGVKPGRTKSQPHRQSLTLERLPFVAWSQARELSMLLM
jgi:hypothetical protein